MAEFGEMDITNTPLIVDTDDGTGDMTYQTAAFYNDKAEFYQISYYMNIAERLAAISIIIFNSLVVAMFVRVLSLVRSASKMILNLSVSHFISATSLILHSTALNVDSLSTTAGACRMVFLFQISARSLYYDCYTCAAIERFIAINMPLFYTAVLPTVLPVLVLAPWLMWVLTLLLGFFGLLNYDVGYVCSSHVFLTPYDINKEMLTTLSFWVAHLTFMLLITSRLLHSTHADDTWELNRQNMEVKTAMIIGTVFAMNFLLKCSLYLNSFIMFVIHSDITYNNLLRKHIFFVISAFDGCLLFLVLLTRKEFRKALWLLLASAETIRRQHPPNFLVAATEGSRKRRSISFADEEELRCTSLDLAARDDPRFMGAEIPDWLFEKRGKRTVNNWLPQSEAEY